MYPISTLYQDYLRRPDREFLVKAEINGVEYNNDVIVDFSIENSLTSLDGFEIGTAIPSTLKITLRTNETIPPNAKIVPYLALSMSDLSWEQATYPWDDMNVTWTGVGTDWLPMGEFYVDNRERINDTWTYSCMDKLMMANVSYISSLTYPTSMKSVWDEIMIRMGWSYDNTIIINPTYQISVAPTGYTMRQVLGYIASANSASVFVGKDGIIKFKRYVGHDESVFEMKSSDYDRVKQTNPIKLYTRVVVTYDTEDDLHYEAGIGDENTTLYIENPFATQRITDNIQSIISDLAYLPIEMDARGYPQFEQGDVISFEQYEGVPWEDANFSWVDASIPWDGIQRYKTIVLRQTFGFAGGLKMAIEAPSVSDQQSEFVVEGSLTQQVNNLDKTAVKEGKNYYGTTITRTEGLVIEREDNYSKVVLNSDEFTFYNGSDKALWFDVPNRKFKFTGTLEGVDGKFTGTIEGGRFIGGSIQIGSSFSVDNSGHMRAVGAEFSGTISAATITGGTINGTNITGADILGSRIRTSVSGDRIELDTDGFIFYDSSESRRVTLGTNYAAGISGHTYYNTSAQSQGLIYANPNELHVIGVNALRIGTNFGTTYIQGSLLEVATDIVKFRGVVDFSDATVIGI